MDLRSLPDGLAPKQRCDERRARVEKELSVKLSALEPQSNVIGTADERNCEQMIGHIPLPVGIAGPLTLTFSTEEKKNVYLPLATTEGALVASVNRGTKALSIVGVRTTSIHHGTSRSVAWKTAHHMDLVKFLQSNEWKQIAEKTSGHLRVLRHEVDIADGHVFLTFFADTDEAMGMNMVTIAADAVGKLVTEKFPDAEFITVAANVDSDKKPSTRVHKNGRGYEATATAELPTEVITDVLKTTPEHMLAVARAKLELGSHLAGAIAANLHAANVIAAVYLATGQDAAHVTEGSLCDTRVEQSSHGLRMSVRLPALMLGVRGGGTGLPAQKQCLDLLLLPKSGLHPCQQLAESIAAAVLAGEVSLLSAQASHSLASAHVKLAR